MADKLTGIVKTGDDVVIPPGLLILAGVVAAAITVILTISYIVESGGHHPSGNSTQPARPPIASSPATVYRPSTTSTTGRDTTTSTVAPPVSPPATTSGTQPYVPAPGAPNVTASQYANPATVTSLFAESYFSWAAPDQLTGAKNRVASLITPHLAGAFPAPTQQIQAPSAIAQATLPTSTLTAGAEQIFTTTVTVTLYAQNGSQYGQTVTEHLQVAAVQQNGKWLVDSFSTTVSA